MRVPKMKVKWQSAIAFSGGSEDAEKKLFKKIANQVHQEIGT